MEDYYNDGYNSGYNREHLNDYHELPQTDGDRYSYRRGYEEGERHKQISDDLDREMYGDDY